MEYELNIAKITQQYPRGLHWALVKFGRISYAEAQSKADLIIASLGRDGFVYSMNEIPPVHYKSWVVCHVH